VGVYISSWTKSTDRVILRFVVTSPIPGWPLVSYVYLRIERNVWRELWVLLWPGVSHIMPLCNHPALDPSPSLLEIPPWIPRDASLFVRRKVTISTHRDTKSLVSTRKLDHIPKAYLHYRFGVVFYWLGETSLDVSKPRPEGLAHGCHHALARNNGAPSTLLCALFPVVGWHPVGLNPKQL